MREHLFRGKTIGGEWIEGDLIRYDSGEVYILPQNSRYWDVLHDADLVIPETVGEWTGLTDVNGIKIFEGDIIKFRMSFHKTFARSGQVIWDDQQLSFICDDQQIGLCAEILVVGNIHDNPELLQTIN